MKKTYKSVLKSSLVMLVLFAVAGSGVAQAQECIARGTSVTARAEGITEEVGTIEVKCRRPKAEEFGFAGDILENLEITVKLNTRITSVIDDDRVVQKLTYTGKKVGDSTVTSTDFGDAKLSEDGTTITWEPLSDKLQLQNPGDMGFQVIIGGIKANTSTVGDGEDVTAVVSVEGAAAHSGSLKLADVTTGLVVEVDKADILQCETDTAKSETATITIQEGFTSAITSSERDASKPSKEDANKFLVTFSGIPEGVTVMVPKMVELRQIADPKDGKLIIDPAAFALTLKDDTRTSGVTVKDGVGTVELSVSGSGAVTYEVVKDTTSKDDADEWVKLTVTFEWEAGDVIDTGGVAVSFAPVSTMGGDTFDKDGAPEERYVASGFHTIIDVSPCLTTLLFPFVTNQLTFNTGLVITNASPESGTCTISFSGANAPDDDMTSQPVAGGAQWIDLASNIAQGFQGYITASCAFRDAHGFAFLTDGYGSGAPTLAQGYLAVCISAICPGPSD